MATLRIWQKFEIDLGDISLSIGSNTVPDTMAITAVHTQTISLATATTTNIFDVTTDLASFDYAVIVSDYAVFLELVVDDGNDVGEVAAAYELGAGLPFVLTSDAAKANYTVNFAAGSNDVIETVRIRNESGSTATVTYAFFKA